MGFPQQDLELRASVASVDADTHIVTLTGELDLHGLDTLRAAVWPLVERHTGSVIVDLSGILFIDSTALGFLVSAAKELRAGDGRLLVASDDPRLRRLLEVTGLLGVLEHEGSLARAVETVVGRA